MSRIVVTGARGFVGRAVCERLVSDGHEVHALVRAQTFETVPAIAGVTETAVGDLFEAARRNDLFVGAAVVVHLAARVHYANERSEDLDGIYSRANSELTKLLAASAARAGVRRFVFMSSVKALAERSRSGALGRHTEPHPEDPYGRSKLAAERVLASIAMQTGLEIVVIRAPLVYGPAAGANFRQLVHWIQAGWPMPFGSVKNRRSLVSVWNLADFAVRCLRPMPSTYEVFHAGDDRPISTAELVALIGDGLGRRARAVSIPPGLLRVAFRLARQEPLIDKLLESLELETAESFRMLDWRPPVRVDEGIVRAVREMTL